MLFLCRLECNYNTEMRVFLAMFIEAYLFFSKDDVEKFKQKDMLAEILKEMTGDYPALTKVFVTERDMYMANVLQNAAKPIPVVDENGGK